MKNCRNSVRELDEHLIVKVDPKQMHPVKAGPYEPINWFLEFGNFPPPKLAIISKIKKIHPLFILLVP
ncbi:hypothetical protein J433_09977 [Corynebacterium glutamicum MT]|uniref:Uncharacterized protein n=1 Tax=Corynebacterium glutamicum TaxID=1718 RepID=A0AB36I4J6_CORGT|nr:hypothetical protein C624_02685 [Corynebacterium glutamicum SCgG1]AGN21149.1 hypothetical protein C629_02685 [Corynebacterium glutamicum SCgG2]EGV41053.1 hypothetical protein CgS9114_05517 [Corynebacterium glutamicum S9114]EOA64141.1 hypothetical protein J433_09977 [Corynebacterium glutamicum MT]EPP41868.1 hypothetical protein A583_02221 [Corynebacterium glutamicum Z188]OKX76189.1 hypothetical protein AUP70_14070 [Corynebacterium glutamicum]